MKLTEITEDAKMKGTYAAAKLSAETKTALSNYFKDNDIPEACDPDDMHCTILFSRKFLPDYKPAGTYDEPIVCTGGSFEIWPSRDVPPKNVLVLAFKSPELTKRHTELMDEHDATYDFAEYKPHMTFSYDFGDRSAETLADVDFDIVFSTEYGEDLDTKD